MVHLIFEPAFTRIATGLSVTFRMAICTSPLRVGAPAGGTTNFGVVLTWIAAAGVDRPLLVVEPLLALREDPQPLVAASAHARAPAAIAALIGWQC